jgi:3-hydroxyisobutyrate dehydrogenase-like beta-hydroxyacid dehydrogenase
MKIGVIGLGRMGAGVAENLLKAGHDVTVWNRSPEPVAELVAKGAVAAKAPEDALQGEALFSILASDSAMRKVGLDGPLLARATKGLIHLNLATISVAFARELAAAHDKHGLIYIASPVFGRPDAAATAQLVPVVGGPDAAIEKMIPVLNQIGRRIVRVGETPEKANLFKITGNFMIASALETVGEAIALLRKGGVDAALFHEVITERLFAGVVFQNYGGMILREAYEPAGFALELGLKDVNLAREAAEGLDMTLPLADLVRDHYEEAMKMGWQEKDWSALGGVIAKKAGL